MKAEPPAPAAPSTEPAAGRDQAPAGEPCRIGVMAARTGVSERTLRYYEQIGLVRPATRSAGGARHYLDSDVARVQRIRQLQALMGFNLEEIKAILSAEDRLERIRKRYRTGTGDSSDLVEDGVAALQDLLAQVDAKLSRLRDFRAELDARLARLQPSGPAGRRRPGSEETSVPPAENSDVRRRAGPGPVRR